MGKAKKSKATRRQQRRAVATDTLPGSNNDALGDDDDETLEESTQIDGAATGAASQAQADGHLSIVDDVSRGPCRAG